MQYYYQYLLDLLTSFSEGKDPSPHFTFAHLSTLTHNYFNHAGYADIPYHRFLSNFFSRNLQRNTVILLYADHHLRFGAVTRTTSFLYESRLPFAYVYLPGELPNFSELRKVLRVNAHRLTSHFDFHPTMLHVLYGKPAPDAEPYGVSLLTEVPENRTCPEAGIAEQYCLCNDFRPINTTSKREQKLLQTLSFFVVQYINKLLLEVNFTTSTTETPEQISNNNSCALLQLKSTETPAFSSVNRVTGKQFRSIHFTTTPGEGTFEAMVEVMTVEDLADNDQMKNPHEPSRRIRPVGVTSVSRTNTYAGQSDCVKDRLDLVSFCYCRSLL